MEALAVEHASAERFTGWDTSSGNVGVGYFAVSVYVIVLVGVIFLASDLVAGILIGGLGFCVR